MNIVDQYRIPEYGPLNGNNQLYGLRDLIEEHLDESSYVCELGTYCGVSASLFAEMCGKVITIDPTRRDCAEEVFQRYDNLEFVQKLSHDAVRDYNIETFDAVYIDADHKYASVARDIRQWWSKVKPGGILCGHDYITREMASVEVEIKWCGREQGFGGVNRAVKERFKDFQTYRDSSWAVKK